MGVYATASAAEYIATGPFKTFICTGWIHDDCREVRVDAVGHEGTMHIFPEVWGEVDLFSEGTCYLYTDEESVSPMISEDNKFFRYNESNELERADDIGTRIYFSCEEKGDQ